MVVVELVLVEVEEVVCVTVVVVDDEDVDVVVVSGETANWSCGGSDPAAIRVLRRGCIICPAQCRGE